MSVDLTCVKEPGKGFGMDIDGQGFVLGVNADGAADEAGIHPGCRITAVNDAATPTREAILAAISGIADGDDVVFSVDLSPPPAAAAPVAAPALGGEEEDGVAVSSAATQQGDGDEPASQPAQGPSPSAMAAAAAATQEPELTPKELEKLAKAAQGKAKKAGVVKQEKKNKKKVDVHPIAAAEYRKGEAFLKSKDFAAAKQCFESSLVALSSGAAPEEATAEPTPEAAAATDEPEQSASEVAAAGAAATTTLAADDAATAAAVAQKQEERDSGATAERDAKLQALAALFEAGTLTADELALARERLLAAEDAPPAPPGSASDDQQTATATADGAGAAASPGAEEPRPQPQEGEGGVAAAEEGEPPTDAVSPASVPEAATSPSPVESAAAAAPEPAPAMGSAEPEPEPDLKPQPESAGAAAAAHDGEEGASGVSREEREAELKALAAAREAEVEARQAEMRAQITAISLALTGKDSQPVAKMLTSSLDRQLVKQGSLRKQGDHKVNPRYFILFGDMMLFCRSSEKKKKNKATSYEYEIRKVLKTEVLAASRLRILDWAEKDAKENALQLFYRTQDSDEDSILYASSLCERDEWVAAIKGVIMGLQPIGYGDHHRLVEGTLHYAALANDAQLVQRILDSPGFDEVDAKDQDGATALHVAAFAGSATAAALLAAGGASGHAMHDAQGRTAVIIAAIKGHIDVISELGDQGVSMDVPDSSDTSALQLAIAQNHMHVASMLVKSGVSPDRTNKDGWSGLHIASAAGQAEQVRQWIAVGCDCNKPTTDEGAPRTRGYTPLLLAAQAPPGAAEATIAVLLEHKADPTFAEAAERKTALQLALEVDSGSVADALVRAGASFEPELRKGLIDAPTAARFEDLSAQHATDLERAAALQHSASFPTGAQALVRDCVVSGWMMVHGATKWNRRFLVVTLDQALVDSGQDGIVLHRYEFDTGEEPLQSVTLPLETCAVEKVEGREPEEFGVLISGVGQAASSRKGGGFKAAFGKKIGAAAALLKKDAAGMYRLSTAQRAEQTAWVRQLMRCGIGGDIEEARRIEEEKKQEEAERQRQEKERLERQESAAAEAWAREELMGGGGGVGGGGGQTTAQLLGDSKAQLSENIQKVSELRDKT
eukprot:COSAG01_NODE_308_length_19148_cov_13.076697_2_plen_1125_part_00